MYWLTFIILIYIKADVSYIINLFVQYICEKIINLVYNIRDFWNVIDKSFLDTRVNKQLLILMERVLKKKYSIYLYANALWFWSETHQEL